ncbi:MAG: DUF3445 domain-containing protein [Sneathiella sp.]
MALPYFPIDDTDFKITMGLQALREAPWMEIDENYKSDTALKNDLLTHKRSSVLAALDQSLDAQARVLKLIEKEFSDHYPRYEPAAPRPDNSPLATAASMVQEDLVLMQRIEGKIILSAACVCFPSGWNLIDKMGLEMQDIHMPVPGLNDRIGKSIDRFLEKLVPGKIVQRFNWGLFDDPALHQPEGHRISRVAQPNITHDNVGEHIFFRVEKQTLQRLPTSDDILFTIRIFNTPLKEIASDPIKTAHLSHTLQTMPDAMLKYKSVSQYEALIFDYLNI